MAEYGRRDDIALLKEQISLLGKKLEQLHKRIMVWGEERRRGKTRPYS